MPLKDLELEPDFTPLPPEIGAFLREADRRIARFQEAGGIPAFVPSDYEAVYRRLAVLAERDAAPGRLFCEWGSGFGVVTCLAAFLEFDAYGIEVEPALVEEAERLAQDFELPVQFVQGSFIPPGSEALLPSDSVLAWLSTDDTREDQDFGLGPEDFDVTFAYPWPDEEQFVERLFDHYAAAGAVLLTYHGGHEIRLRRKVAARRAGRGRSSPKPR